MCDWLHRCGVRNDVAMIPVGQLGFLLVCFKMGIVELTIYVAIPSRQVSSSLQIIV